MNDILFYDNIYFVVLELDFSSDHRIILIVFRDSFQWTVNHVIPDTPNQHAMAWDELTSYIFTKK